MTDLPSSIERLADLLAIETQIADSLDAWAGVLRDYPEAAGMIDRMQATSRSHRDALDRAFAWKARKPARGGPYPLGIVAVPPSPIEALRQVAETTLAAALACEVAYQTARLSGDGEMCDLFESLLSDHARTVVDARRVLPHVVAADLRRAGVTCACRCPMCSLGACGCIRATVAATDVAWGGEEPVPTAGLVLQSPPRPGSQLAAAGLDEGDRILTVDGDNVGRNAEAQAALRRHKPGDEVRIEVERHGGERIVVMVRRVG